MRQRLHRCQVSFFDADDAERAAKAPYEALLSKQRRGVHHVPVADVAAGKQAVRLAHSVRSEAYSKLDKVVQLLSAFESSRFPEVAFFLCVRAACGSAAGDVRLTDVSFCTESVSVEALSVFRRSCLASMCLDTLDFLFTVASRCVCL